ncbi:HesB/IscA family protein [Candidatus Nesciobacter abundans]|uniref:Iron-sulfur cluster assembly accessory protein n=1 Tax=Candidatus Nesciobacter abundans TaxID=2601668 RepID=A0A5C0UHQ4_9PROT|nr:iron-sulfur cluster assembly accessory protein [Candidatus Nesciobacter abundans]QEK39267.1 iron-sulfur cluster assembly accessory protein [Candidatus Nesciobacter abundans]
MSCSTENTYNQNIPFKREDFVAPEFTANAIKAIKDNFDNYYKEKNVMPLGIKIMTERGGCSGLEYKMEYIFEESEDKVKEIDGVGIFIPNDSMGHLNGSQIDFEETAISAGFIFKNPNEKCKCACGSSFNA